MLSNKESIDYQLYMNLFKESSFLIIQQSIKKESNQRLNAHILKDDAKRQKSTELFGLIMQRLSL
jgi:hypothetical protein